MIIIKRNLGSKIVVCARVGGANTTPIFLAVHFAKRNTKFGGGGKRGRAKIPSPQTPFPSRSARLVRQSFNGGGAVWFLPRRPPSPRLWRAGRRGIIRDCVPAFAQELRTGRQKRFERRSVIAQQERVSRSAWMYSQRKRTGVPSQGSRSRR
mgnify:CR=1 FL=1